MVTPPALRAPSGRIFFRHSSGMGSVMIFNDRGTWRRVLVLDAKYRTEKQFGLYGVEIPEFQGFELETPNSFFLNYPTSHSTEAPDFWVNKNIFWDSMTSRERCDIWMKYKKIEDQAYSPILGCPAVQYCRSIQVNGIPCDLPNIQTLARIYVDRETIDQMDPTVEEYPMSRYSLKKWEFPSTPFAWSSTEDLSYFVRYVFCDGCCSYHRRETFGAIVPILEL